MMSGAGHEPDMPTALKDVRSQGQGGKHLLEASISGFDPERTSAMGLVCSRTSARLSVKGLKGHDSEFLTRRTRCPVDQGG